MSNSDSTNTYNNERIFSEQIDQQGKALSSVANLLFKLENKLDQLTTNTLSHLSSKGILRGDVFTDNRTKAKPKKRKKKKTLLTNASNATNPSPSYYFNIGTINVMMLTEIKLQQLMDYINKENIDILNTGLFKGTGTILVIKKLLARHILHIEKIDNRMVMANFIFKKNMKLSVISIYNHTATQWQAQTTLNKKLLNLIYASKRKNHKLIILEDLNLNYRRFKNFTSKGKSLLSNYKLLQNLTNTELYDIQKELLNIDN
ncbi:hypothetical protein GLOIN_2v1475603 [Rhizophagus clarus]|uniref:Endonuclease/exonuclease/phosphatase domain-containing protein n=1 Tax=Rhizophagus clarus TaxID=94130 RepID=A0A8H3QMR8_9GLOM|nr:hypothetical protein GLOIN_2v1475603 [Rhizophagus clarus]